jgi:glycosyltransferase involved in cell wall biosynthesis
LAGVDYSVTVHGSDVQRPRLIDGFLIRKLTDAQFIICVSASLRERVRSLLRGREMPPIHVVHTGLDRSALDDPRPPAPGALRRPHLLSVGRLASEKGHRHLLAAVRYLRDRTTNVRLDVIGDGPECKRLQGDIDRLELRRAVRLRGAMSEQDVWARYRRADIFVLPSLREGLPVALLEAMAAGLPVVASDLPGVREAVEHEQTGLLAPPGDATALAEAVSRLIADPELRARLSAAARQVVEDYFLIEDNIRDLAALFEDES